MATNRILINPSRVTLFLAAISVLLVLASIVGQLIFHLTPHDTAYGMIRLFKVNAENNLPTYFSALLLLSSALLILIITILESRQRSSYTYYWAALSGGFVLMAADEALSFHERLALPVRDWVRDSLDAENLGIFYFSWVIPGIALVLVLGLIFFRFWWNLPFRTRIDFLGAALLYVGGAIGIEMVGGWYAEAYGGNLTFNLIATLEEALEMAGSILFIRALLLYLAESHRKVQFRIEGARENVGLRLPLRARDLSVPG